MLALNPTLTLSLDFPFIFIMGWNEVIIGFYYHFILAHYSIFAFHYCTPISLYWSTSFHSTLHCHFISTPFHSIITSLALQLSLQLHIIPFQYHFISTSTITSIAPHSIPPSLHYHFIPFHYHCNITSLSLIIWYYFNTLSLHLISLQYIIFHLISLQYILHYSAILHSIPLLLTCLLGCRRECELNAKLLGFKEASKCVPLSPNTLPSILIYTIMNTHQRYVVQSCIV